MAMKPRRIVHAHPVRYAVRHPWRALEDKTPSRCTDLKKWRPFLKTMNEEGILPFYSKSACGVQRYLSNFQETPSPLVFLGTRFRTVEHAFQAAKWLYTKRGVRKDMFEMLAVGGKWGNLPGKNVKAKGGKGAFSNQKPKEELDMHRWNAQRVNITRALLKARARVDPLFRSIVARAQADGVMPVHFVSMRGRKGGVPFWGVRSIKKKNPGYLIGENMLGKLLMSL